MKNYSFFQEAAPWMKAAMGQAKFIGGNVVNHIASNPIIASTAIGAMTGGIHGALKKDENGKRNPIGGALGAMKGAVAGSAIGGVGKYALGKNRLNNFANKGIAIRNSGQSMINAAKSATTKAI